MLLGTYQWFTVFTVLVLDNIMKYGKSNTSLDALEIFYLYAFPQCKFQGNSNFTQDIMTILYLIQYVPQSYIKF